LRNLSIEIPRAHTQSHCAHEDAWAFRSGRNPQPINVRAEVRQYPNRSLIREVD